MATMISGETYFGEVLILPLTPEGEVTVYLWPLRCLKGGIGGPTFGVDVGGEEVLRYDPHGDSPRGHFHTGGYDKLGAGGSHRDFPQGVDGIPGQVSWSLSHLHENVQRLLDEAGHHFQVDSDLVTAAIEAVKSHLEAQGDLRPRAIEAGALAA